MCFLFNCHCATHTHTDFLFIYIYIYSPPDFIFSIYYHQALDLIGSEINKPLTPKSKKKPLQNVCSIFFEDKGVEFINIAPIFHHPGIVNSLPSLSVKFPMPMVT